MCRVWAEVLGIGRVGLDDNFFEIGRTLAAFAARLFPTRQGVRPVASARVLFAAPTVRVLAESYRVSSGTAGVIPRSSRSRPAARCGHLRRAGDVGNVIGFAELSRELGSHNPFYGLQIARPRRNGSALDSIDGWQDAMQVRFRRFSRTDPTFSRRVLRCDRRYEMARQLLAAGEEVHSSGCWIQRRRITSE